MLTIEQVDTAARKQVNEFIRLPFQLYANTPQWCPPFLVDMRTMLDRQKHPYYEHSEGDFFLARTDGEVVGRIGIFHNRPFNQYHGTKEAHFYLFDCINDQGVADALFNRAFEWCHARGLDAVIGPKGLSGFDGYGIQVEGTEHPQMMTMMNYNFPYYQMLVECQGFEKEVDFVSCYLPSNKFHLQEKVHLIADKVRERGRFKVVKFTTKKDLKAWAWKIGHAYNKTFINNWEYYPFTDREIKFLLDNLLLVADPRLIKIITYDDEVVGFAFGFPDVTKALQRAKGRLTPWGLIDILRTLKTTNWISMNGMGVLPEYQGRGGNALLYDEMERTLRDYHYEHAELTQVAETTKQMRADLINLGGSPYKNHRVYHMKI